MHRREDKGLRAASAVALVVLAATVFAPAEPSPQVRMAASRPAGPVGPVGPSGPVGPAAPSGPECRPQSAGERPSATSDDLVNCIFERLGPGRVRLTVSYTYASSLGKTNIWLGVDVLAGGNRLKWFGYRPAPIAASGGTVSLELIFGVNSPPARTLTTDQVEFFMYVGGGQIFHRKMFNLRLDWQL